MNELQEFPMDKGTSEIKPKLNGYKKNKLESLDGSDKRRRSSNFHFKEIEDLLSLIDVEKSIVECKRTDQLTNSYKDKTWKRMSHMFNRKNVTKRSDKQLRSKWETLKKIARKEYSNGNLSTVSTKVVKIMLSCNGMDININSGNPIKMKEEPYFYYDNGSNAYNQSCNNDELNQDEGVCLMQTNRETNIGSEINDSRNNKNQVGLNHADQSTNSQIEEFSNLTHSEVCLVSRATQYDIHDVEKDQKKFQWYAGLKRISNRNFEKIFYSAENRRKKEKHSLEMKILRLDLAIKKRQLENLRR